MHSKANEDQVCTPDVHAEIYEDRECTPHVHMVRRDVPMRPNERANIARCAPDECVSYRPTAHGLTTEEDGDVPMQLEDGDVPMQPEDGDVPMQPTERANTRQIPQDVLQMSTLGCMASP